MKYRTAFPISALALAMASSFALANDSGWDTRVEKSVIALKTGDFELAETDISHLAVGDAETVYTEDGRAIDILRTEQGVEIYVDGERLDMGAGGVHEDHRVVEQRYEVICADDEDCEKHVWVTDGEDIDLDALHEEGLETRVIVIKERSEID